MRKKVSVIVPIYGVEKYLNQCVESILHQTYSNLEVILVDDGSPDRSGEIADEFSKKDSRVQVIHKPNGGLSDARNVGIEHATGDYITLIDSDDYVHPQMIEFMLEAAGDGEEDVVITSYQVVNEGTEPEILSYQDVQKEAVDGKAIQELYVKYSQKQLNYTVAWGKLYRRNCFDAIRYPKGKVHEDEYVTFQILYEAQKIVYLDLPLYFYLSRESSIMGEFSAKRFDIFCGYETRIHYYMKSNESELAKKTFFLAIHMLAQYQKWMNKKDEASIKAFQSSKSILKECMKKYDEKWSMRGREKVEKFLFSISFSLYYLLWKMMK